MIKKIILVVMAGLAVGGVLYWLGDLGSVDNPDLAAERTSQPSNGRAINQDEVAQHKNAEDCWTIINTQVFDLTTFIADHPGGSEILRACGQDGSSLFNNRTTEDGQSVGSGRSHSGSAVDILSELYIGDLVE